jgi:hypothetical protein
MKSFSLASLSLVVVSLFLLSACKNNGPVDVTNPTVDQLDDLDVQWGLERRKDRGGPKRFFSKEILNDDDKKKLEDKNKPADEPIEEKKSTDSTEEPETKRTTVSPEVRSKLQ